MLCLTTTSLTGNKDLINIPYLFILSLSHLRSKENASDDRGMLQEVYNDTLRIFNTSIKVQNERRNPLITFCLFQHGRINCY